MRTLGKIASALAAIVALAAMWDLVSHLLDSPALPGPAVAAAAFVELFLPELLPQLWVSAGRVVTALAIGTAVGVPLGLGLGRSSRLDALIAPVIWVTYPIPKITLLPVFFVLLGAGNVTKVSLLAVIVFFQIVVTVRDAARAIPVGAILSVRSLGANRWDIARHVVLPATLPGVMTSMRLSIGHAVAVLFFAETVAGTDGIGYFVMDAWTRIQFGEMLAGVLAMALLGAVLYETLHAIERRVCRWTETAFG